MKNLLNKAISAFKKTTNNDSWRNFNTGLGAYDGRVGASFVKQPNLLTYQDLNRLYTGNGIAKRIVNCLVDDSLRSGFFDSKTEEIKDEFKRLGLVKIIKEACYFSRLYGGACLLALVDDGSDELDVPINEANINKVINFKVFDKQWIMWQEQDLVTNYLSERFGLPEYYTITQPYYVGTESQMIRVHYSRIFILDGVTTSQLNRIKNRNWGDSVLQSCFDSLRHYGLVSEASAEIVTDFIQVIIKLNDLSRIMVGNDLAGKNALRTRLQSLDISRSVSNLICLDSDKEDYSKNASSVAGLGELWDKFSEAICAATGYPITRLFGQSPGGLNSTGVSDMRNYYDLVSAYRSDELEPVLDWVIKLITLQKTWKHGEVEWSFANLVEQTPLEMADIKKKYAEIDCMYIDRGAIDGIEAWQERFGQDEFKEDIKLKEPEPKDENLTEEDLTLINSLTKTNENKKENVDSERLISNALDKLISSI